MEISAYPFKADPDPSHSLCCTCLSSDRRLLDLVEFRELFNHIMRYQNLNEVDYRWSDTMHVCWECLALLRKVGEFHAKAVKAKEALDTAVRYGTSMKFDSMSKLRMSTPDKFVIFNLEDNFIPVKTEEDPNFGVEVECTETDLHDFKEVFNDDVSENNSEDDFLFKIKNKIKENESEIPEGTSERDKLSKDKLPVGKIKKRNEMYTHDLVEKSRMEKSTMNQQEMLDFREQLRSRKDFQQRPYKCNSCIVGFWKEKYYLSHLEAKHGPMKTNFICSVCETKFTKKRDLGIHLSRHYCLYKCRICGYTHSVSLNFHKHMGKHNEKFKDQTLTNDVTDVIKHSRCPLCKITFNSHIEFIIHKYKLHKSFICDICNKVFHQKWKLQSHLLNNHGFDRPRVCRECNKTFENTLKLKNHSYAMHRGEPPELRYCVECDTTFRNVYTYARHVQNLHGPKRVIQKHPCPQCGKELCSRSAMKIHIKTIHEKKTDHYCPEHDKYYAKRKGLLDHITKVHQGVSPPKTKICPHCGRAFSARPLLENHIRTHTGERPFKCPHCTSAFAQKVALKYHVKHVHMKEPRKPQKRYALPNAEDLFS